MKVNAFFSKLAESQTIDEFKRCIAASIQPLGFTDFFLTVLDNNRSGGRPGLTTLPKEIVEFHLKDDFSSSSDLVLEHAAQSDQPVFLSQVEHQLNNAPFKSARLDLNIEYLNLLASHGYHDGYCMARQFGPTSEGLRAALLLYTKDADNARFQNTIEHLASLLSMILDAIMYFSHIKFAQHFLSLCRVGILDITPMPLQLLNVVAKEGLRLKNASTQLGISLDTANKHIASAKEALGASTLAQAVYLGVKYGVIKKD